MNDNVRRIGIRVIPDDVDIANFVKKLDREYQVKVDEIKIQLEETINQTLKQGQPRIFAFAKLLNYLATLEKPELIEMLSSTLWKEVN